jgi:hypothetical protein
VTNRDRVVHFFDEYVRLTLGDIEREIDDAHAGNPAGNFLCALALLAYTEVLGGIKRNTMKQGQARKNFDSFFADLGPEYQAVERKLNARGGEGVYGFFRCGLAHQGFFKPPGQTVAMKEGSATCGIVEDPRTGNYTFVVERYYKDFQIAAEKLKAKKLAQTRPRFPPELRSRREVL